MARIIVGDRIGKLGSLRVGCSAVIFDGSRMKILLTRRRDNAQWCLPSGGMHPGESASEACVREVEEETGLQVEPIRLIGIYTTPHELIEYPDGNRVQLVGLCFEVRVISGTLQLSDETSEYGYFAQNELSALDLLPNHTRRIKDAFNGSQATVIQ